MLTIQVKGQSTRPTLIVDGDTDIGHLGHAVGILGDVDGDGVADLLVGEPSPASGSGRVLVVSGATGELLAATTSETLYFGGSVLALPDVDGDGICDYGVGHNGPFLADAPSGVTIASGASGAVVATIVPADESPTFGWSLSPAGDVNGDGLGEIAIGAPLANSVFIYDLKTLECILKITPEDELLFGFDVAYLGDANNNGLPEIAVGAPGGSQGASGSVSVFELSEGNVLWESNGASYSQRGYVVDGGQDVTGDGVSDLVVTEFPFFQLADQRVLVLSGLDGEVAHEFTPEGWPPTAEWGLGLAMLGDSTGDGVSELAITDSGSGSNGRVYVYTGGSFEALARWNAEGGAPVTFEGFGASVSGGDIDGDAYSEIIVGARYASYEAINGGRVYLFRAGPWAIEKKADSGVNIPSIRGVGSFRDARVVVDIPKNSQAAVLLAAPALPGFQPIGGSMRAFTWVTQLPLGTSTIGLSTLEAVSTPGGWLQAWATDGELVSSSPVLLSTAMGFSIPGGP